MQVYSQAGECVSLTKATQKGTLWSRSNESGSQKTLQMAVPHIKNRVKKTVADKMKLFKKSLKTRFVPRVGCSQKRVPVLKNLETISQMSHLNVKCSI